VTGEDREGLEGYTAAVQEHNRLVNGDDRYVSAIVPLRDGVTVALRVR
jgi:predicted O-methyltransferase YrrM